MISVIIPNYNHEQYLQQRIESVLQQSYPNFEVIILDDASTDNSVDIINHYRNHPKVTHIAINKKNSGSPFKQWIKGIELARGEYIWIAESDDWASPDFLNNLTTVLYNDISLALVYCQSFMVNEKGNVIRNNIEWTDDLDARRWLKPFKNNGNKEIESYLLFKNTIPNASAVLFKKEYAIEAIGSLTKFYYLGDWFFWIKLLEKGGLAFLPQMLNYFRAHSLSTRNHRTAQALERRYSEQYVILNELKRTGIISSVSMQKAFSTLFYKWINYTGVNVWRKKEYRRLFLKALHSDPALIKKYLRYSLGTIKNKHLVEYK